MKQFKKLSLLLALVMIFSSFSAGFANSTTTEFPKASIADEAKIYLGSGIEEVTVIIELKAEPVLKMAIDKGVTYSELSASEVKTQNQKIRKQQEVLVNDLKKSGIELNAERTYTTVLNGFSAKVKVSDLAKIEANPNVKKVRIAKEYYLPEPNMVSSTGQVMAPETWNLGFKGEGMVVAVIDSGIDHTHKDFNITTGTAVALDKAAVAAIIAGQELNAEKLAALKPGVVVSADNCYKSAKVPFAFDYADNDTTAKADMTLPEASEHGQHVSGTVAANGAIKGVAPEAQILGLKVFSDGTLDSNEQITTTDDVIINAIEDAVKFNADVINMSLGATSGFTLPDDPEQIAIKNARDAGIVVAISAGNSSRVNDYSNVKTSGGYPDPFSINTDTGLLGSPSATSESLSVANMENKSIYTSALRASDASQYPYSNTAPERPISAVTPTTPIEFVFCGLGGANDFAGKNVTGKVALIERGGFSFVEKVVNAQTNGAVAVVVFNSAAGGNALMGMALDNTVTIPAVFIGRNVGLHLNSLSTKTVFFPSDLQLIENPVGYQMDESTSWGPTPNLEFKPEITAPGGNIYSTLNDDKYGVKSGTSMAAPHVAGASAIMLQRINSDPDHRFDTWTAKDKAIFAKNLLMSTAMPAKIPGTNDYFSPRRSGAGLMNVEAAALTNAYLYSMKGHTEKQSKVTLREIKDKVATFDVVVNNFSADEKSFYLSATAQTDKFTDLNGSLTKIWNVGTPANIPNAKLEVALNANVVLGQLTTSSGTAIGFDPNTVTGKFDVLTTNFSNTSSSAVKVTVPGNSEQTVSFTLDLTNSAFVSSMFGPLDFFAEGFINFTATDTTQNVDLSIPYLGYNGDWNKQSILDASNYDTQNISQFASSYLMGLYQEEGEWWGSALGLTEEGNKVNFEGMYSAFSPNNDGYLDSVAPKLTFNRNAKTVNIAIYDENANRLGYVSLNDYEYIRKHFSRNGKFTPYYAAFPGSYYEKMIWDGTINGTKVKDGQYFYMVESTLDFPGAETQYMAMPIFVDTVAPEIKSIGIKGVGDTRALALTLSENHFVNYVQLTDLAGVAIGDPIYYYNFNNINIKDITQEEIKVVAVDFAGNKSLPYKVRISEKLVQPEKPTPQPTIPPTEGGGSVIVAPPTTTPTTPTTPVTPVAGQAVASNQVTVKVEGAKATVEVTAAGITEAAKQGAVVVIEVPKSAEGKAVEVSIPADVMKDLAKEGKKVVIQSGNVAFSIEGGFANTGDAKNIVVKMETTTPDYSNAGDKEALGVAYELDITNGTDKITGFDKKPEITITLPAGTTNPQNIGAYVQNTDGTWAFVMTYFNAENGTVSFKAPHFSKYALMRYNKTFADINGHWAKNTIEEMASLHITKGVTETQFAPKNNVTRAEFITWILRALGEEAGGTKFPTDVNAKDWYAPYLAKAMTIGLIEEGKFRPTDEITREEMAMFITKGHALLNNITPKFNAEYDMFKDVDKTSPNAKYINYLAEMKIVSGVTKDTFKPQNKASRAEAMTMIKNMLFLKK